MTLAASTLDDAYEIFEEFGPIRKVPRKERLRAHYPELSSAEIETLLEQMKEVSETAWSIAELGGTPQLGKQKVVESLQARHPFLQKRGLDRAVFITDYFAWHEGYAVEPVKPNQAPDPTPPSGAGHL